MMVILVAIYLRLIKLLLLNASDVQRLPYALHWH